jgi:hypothetical protein
MTDDLPMIRMRPHAVGGHLEWEVWYIPADPADEKLYVVGETLSEAIFMIATGVGVQAFHEVKTWQVRSDP